MKQLLVPIGRKAGEDGETVPAVKGEDQHDDDGGKEEQEEDGCINFCNGFHGLQTSFYVPSDKLAHDGHTHQQQDHQHEGDGGGKVQVVGDVLALDHVADEHDLTVAQLLGDIEGTHRGNEDHRHAGDDTRQAQGPDDPAQHA